MTRRYAVATAPGRATSRHWDQRELTWKQVVSWTDHPATRKECGGYVAGLLEPTQQDDHGGPGGCFGLHRTKEGIFTRSMAALDADKATAALSERVAALGCRALVHTTYSSRPDALRLRLLFPTDRDMRPDEYRRVVEVLMERLGREQFDHGSAEPARFMYKPSAADPDAFQRWLWDGAPLAVDELLREHDELWPAGTSEPAPAGPPPELDALPSPVYVQEAVAGVLADLDALAAMPDGTDTTLGGALASPAGWDTAVYVAACRLVKAANSASGYTLADAERDFYAHAPAADGTYDPEHKWHSAVKNVAREPLRPAGEPSAAPAPAAVADDSYVSTWSGMDLTGYLDGTYSPPVPRLMARTDGVCLLYPGLTHSIHGESESGKSLVIQHECVVLMERGEHVCYFDFESDPGSLVERLLMLGASREAIAERFVYLQPGTDPERYGPDRDALLATLAAHPYALVVIDGVSESMDVVVGDSKDPNAAAIEWNRKLPRLVVSRTGGTAAVVQIDHVTKNPDTRGRFAIGGQAKLSALTGAAYSLDVAEPLGRGLRGELVMRVAKDRPGYVRGRAGTVRPADRTQEAARIIVDSMQDPARIVVRVEPPRTGSGAAAEAQVLLMERVSDFLGGLPADHPGAGTNMVKREVRGNNDDIALALQALVEGGYVSRTAKGQSQLHKLTRAFMPDLEEAGNE